MEDIRFIIFKMKCTNKMQISVVWIAFEYNSYWNVSLVGNWYTPQEGVIKGQAGASEYALLPT